MIELLKPIFRGPFATYGEGLACSEVQPPGTVRLEELLGTTDAFEALLSRQADCLGTGDLRPVASAWMLQYTALLVPPVAAAATLLGHVLPVGYRDAAIDIDVWGLPRRIIVPHLGHSAVGLNTACRYATLLAAHLTPLILRLSQAAGLPGKILWGSVSRRLDATLEQATAMAPAADLAALIEEDRDYLLQQRTWSLGQRNPLFGARKTAQLKLADGRQSSTRLHRQCCLHHLLPGKEHCGACPLSPQLRQVEQCSSG